MSEYNSKPISQWPVGASVQSSDEYVATDTLDRTDSPSGTTKKYKISQLASYITDSVVSNLKTALVATTADLTATYYNGGNDDGIGATLTNDGAQVALIINGVTVALNDRILVKNQTDDTQNGIYFVTNIGSASTNWVLERSVDYDNSTHQITKGDFIGVVSGTSLPRTFWFQTASTPVVIGTDAIIFQQSA